MAKKKSNNKKNYISKNNKLIIRIIILLLSIFASLKAGFFGLFLFHIVTYLFGDFTYFFLIFITITSIFLVLDKEYLVFKHKIGRAMIFILLSIFFYMSNVFYQTHELSYTLSNLISDINVDTIDNGTGIIGWLIALTIIKVVGYAGLLILTISLLLAGIYLIIDIKKIKQWFEFNDEVVEKKQVLKSDTIELENTKDPISENEKQKKIKKETKLFEFPVFRNQKVMQQDIDPLFSDSSFGRNNTSQNDKISINIVDDPILDVYKKQKSIPEQKLPNYENDILFNKRSDENTPIVEQNKKSMTKDKENRDLDIPIYMQEDVDIREDIHELRVKVSEKNYVIPSINLLKGYGDNSKQLTALKSTAKQKATLLKTTLSSFGLNVEILNIHIGPNVTKYELQPEMGVKVAKFNSLSNDIALALAANGVRIEAPIPGKAAVGIEIANDYTMMVSLKEVLLSNNNDYASKLQIGLGKDISGNAVFTDITKTPHLLVAGSTGSGKSVCINSIIISILTKASPDDVKLLMIDPKKVELTPYNGIPHLLAPVVTEPKKAVSNLAQMVAEMDWRYELFAETNTRNIDSYNKKVQKDDSSYSKIPYIVVIIDELADLMMVASKEVEDSIARLAQMARASGIHLIIATQRPSTDVITGLIKANIPSRIAFAVSSGIDSRTILDTSGAEKLLGRGDMLYSEQGSNNLHRIQGAYLSDEEVEAIVKQVATQFTEEEISVLQDSNLSEVQLINQSDTMQLDEIYETVKIDVIKQQKASTSQIQRRYKVGYNRAANIMDQLEHNGIIAQSEGTKPRKVLVSEDIHD